MVFLVYADANEPRKPNTATVSNTGGRKTPKTLSGIETSGRSNGGNGRDCRKTPKTLSGIETGFAPPAGWGFVPENT